MNLKHSTSERDLGVLFDEQLTKLFTTHSQDLTQNRWNNGCYQKDIQ